MSGCAPIRGREENRGGKGSTGTRLIKAGKLGGVSIDAANRKDMAILEEVKWPWRCYVAVCLCL